MVKTNWGQKSAEVETGRDTADCPISTADSGKTGQKTTSPYKGKLSITKNWYKQIGVKSQLRLKPAVIKLIVQYLQLILAKPVKEQQVPIIDNCQSQKIGINKLGSKIS